DVAGRTRLERQFRVGRHRLPAESAGDFGGCFAYECRERTRRQRPARRSRRQSAVGLTQKQSARRLPNTIALCPFTREADECSVPQPFLSWGRQSPSPPRERPLLLANRGARLRARLSAVTSSATRNPASRAAGVGFEPTSDLSAANGFQDRPVRPLRHPAEPHCRRGGLCSPPLAPAAHLHQLRTGQTGGPRAPPFQRPPRP